MLSKRQQDTYQFIRDYILRHGHGPVLEEIANGLGIQSRGSVHRYVQTLVDAGLIAVESGRHRGISLLEDSGVMAPATSLPMVGRIAAGHPIEAIPGEERIDLGEFFMGPGRFVLKVQGDSMCEAGILDGDMVVIQQADTASNGDIVVALIDHEVATLKTLLRHDDGSLTLRAENSLIPPFRYPADRVQIQGIVVGQMRSYR
ncbi:MAG: repressor LexA [Gammaproteobacteria bacterium]|nr:repressor LexA [Gammaproteobacteria bacterium]